MAKNRALFLDRDGVINIEQGYVHRREDFRFQPGIFDLCRAAQSLGYLIVVVTNQAGIGRGYYSESTFLELTAWMVDRFAEEQVEIARVYYCPYHPFDGIGPYRYDSPDRKPKPGMILRARTDFDLDLTASVLVGDKPSDIQAGTAAGVGTNILLGPIPTAADSRRERDCYTSDSLDDILRRFFAHDERGDAEGSPGMFLRPCKPFCVGES